MSMDEGKEPRNSPQDYSHKDLPLDEHRVGCQALTYAHNLGIDRKDLSIGWVEDVENEIKELIESREKAAMVRMAEEIKKMIPHHQPGMVSNLSVIGVIDEAVIRLLK